MSEKETSKPKLSNRKILIIGIVSLAVIIIAVGVIVVFALNKKDAAPVGADYGKGNIVVDDNFDEDALRAKAADNMFEVKMNQTWSFKDGASASTDAYVANSTANSAPFFFEVFPLDTEGTDEEIVYTSPKIPVGSAVEGFKLDKPVEKGAHKYICRYNILDKDDVIEDSVQVTVTLSIDS